MEHILTGPYNKPPNNSRRPPRGAYGVFVNIHCCSLVKDNPLWRRNVTHDNHYRLTDSAKNETAPTLAVCAFAPRRDVRAEGADYPAPRAQDLKLSAIAGNEAPQSSLCGGSGITSKGDYTQSFIYRPGAVF
ncbi:MAG: hypothetical protein ACMX3H_05970 [Sodalis sp. (in: enterobacteria)]|uniref:hypothetical protein n=1 Tax=Sodalis sp. (in: enterobacteria) TaxID=1898979 RepID=UPI0039E3CA3C